MTHATSPESGLDLRRTETVRRLSEQHATDRGALMVVLHAVMTELGHIERQDVETIADVLNLSMADVHGVVSFYKDFRTEPAPAHTVQLCRAEACQAVGAERLHAEAREQFAERDDVEVDEVFCLGNCALGPSGMVDGRLHGRLSRERLLALSEEWVR
ncbi:NAD(P)H-dependent oxidoreductase subunit E [Intrasporangium sp. DVR]|uniref:NAD(P)H-dependent oxidoreductase subunit E n=1 Tax=Intrasporangium sp. DVR TaxID=3127867 RepID=UPI00313A7193